jgi:hypothetical protein
LVQRRKKSRESRNAGRPVTTGRGLATFRFTLGMAQMVGAAYGLFVWASEGPTLTFFVLAAVTTSLTLTSILVFRVLLKQH